jgi:hypothetical protein
MDEAGTECRRKSKNAQQAEKYHANKMSCKIRKKILGIPSEVVWFYHKLYEKQFRYIQKLRVPLAAKYC